MWVLVCAVLAILLEHHQKQTQIKSFGSALFWTTMQLLTVSSRVQNPISFPGRVLHVAEHVSEKASDAGTPLWQNHPGLAAELVIGARTSWTRSIRIEAEPIRVRPQAFSKVGG